jgi:serine/threonine protein kinase
MAAPATNQEFLELVRKSGVLDEKRLDAHLAKLRAAGLPEGPGKLAGFLVQGGLLTDFQAEQLLQGKWRRFTIGKYKVLERLGSGGMGSVYLCEHKLMRRRVAVKVLPTAKAADESSLQRFYREARAAAALDHPNIVHAYDIDQDETLHFLVMEYVDGSNLQDIIKKNGQMEPSRAAHYIRQAALGLDHAHRAGLVHRDIKPGNLLLDRTGTLKVLDMGLARFFNDEDDILTRQFEENVLGTADYLAPEQALDSHSVDIRADIYSLGATFYYLLTGRTPFGEGTVAQKLIWHQTRQPRPIANFRPDVPPDMAAVLEKMMAKDASHRYQTPMEVAEALEPWTQNPLPPPPESEMPRLSPAVVATGPQTEQTVVSSQPGGPTSPSPRKTWQVATPPSSTTPVIRHPGPALAPGPPATSVARGGPSVPSLLASPPPRPASMPTAPPLVSAKVEVAAPSVLPVSPLRQAPLVDLANGPKGEPVVSPAEAEPAPWEGVLPETGNLNFEDDTTPGPRGAQTSPRRAGWAGAAALSDSRRLRWVLLGVGAVFLVILIVSVVVLVVKKPPPEGPPAERKPLLVSRKGNHPGAYPTVQQALLGAREGDVIELLDAEHEETLKVAPNTLRAGQVTVQAHPGLTVTWKCAKGQEKDPILLFSSVPQSFHFNGQGITLDGRDRMARLVVLTGHCDGLTLEGVRMQGFTETAIRVVNCGGSQNRPVRIIDVKTAPPGKEKPKAAIFFDIRKGLLPTINEFIVIGDGCQFDSLANPIHCDPGVAAPSVQLPKGAGGEGSRR